MDSDREMKPEEKCLSCGYLLCGHAQDPVVCPECGRCCDRRLIRECSDDTERELRRLESIATVGVAVLVGSLALLVLGVFLADVALGVIGALGFVLWCLVLCRLGALAGSPKGWLLPVLCFQIAGVWAFAFLGGIGFLASATYNLLSPTSRFVALLCIAGAGASGLLRKSAATVMIGPYDIAKRRFEQFFRMTILDGMMASRRN